MFDATKLRKWVKRAKATQENLAELFGLKGHSSISLKLRGRVSISADQLGRLMDLFRINLSEKEMGECVSEIFGFYIAIPKIRQDEVVNSEILSLYRELSQARKELNEQKDRIHELERALDVYKQRMVSDRRSDDPPDINNAKMRRPVKVGNNNQEADL